MDGLIDFMHNVRMKMLNRYSDGLRAGRLEFDSRQGQGIFLYFTVSTQSLGPAQPPIQMVPGALSPGSNAAGV
jgi:hypothetical protein